MQNLCYFRVLKYHANCLIKHAVDFRLEHIDQICEWLDLALLVKKINTYLHQAEITFVGVGVVILQVNPN